MVMIVSIFTIIPFSASAKEDNLGSKVGNDLSEIIGATEFEANVEFVETEGTEIPKDSEPETFEAETVELSTLSAKTNKDVEPVGEMVNGFTYNVSNKEATITAYNDKSVTSLTIPGKIGGYKVTAIGNSAFSNYSNLSSVSIPDSVITIGNDAFYNTPWYNNQPDGLVYAGRVAYKYKGTMDTDTVITLKDNTTSITGRTFYECTGLKQIKINDSLQSIGNEAFYHCTSLTSIIIPGSVVSISSSSFSSCSSLDSVVISEGTTEIGNYAFSSCSALETITLPNSITRIGNYAFSYDVSLVNPTLPKNLTNLGYRAFEHCTSLTEMTIPKNTVAEATSDYYSPFRECENLRKMIFEDGTTVISKYIAGYCTGLEEVIIPNTVTEIGSCAFYYCTGMETVVLPDSVTKINNNAFYGNTALCSLTLSKQLTEMTGYTFGDCTSLKEIVIPKTLKTTGNAFSNSGLEKVKFESGSTIVPNGIFSECKKLTNVIIPDGLTEIGNYAFSSCSALETITLPNSITRIGNYAFSYDVSLVNLTLPKNLTNLGYRAFEHCTSLTEMTIPKNTVAEATSDYYSPFRECENLRKMVFEDGTTVISKYIAGYCTGLEEVIIPNTVTEIGSCAFYYCNSLENIYLPASMAKIGNNAFYNCNKLTVYCSKYSKIVIGLIDDGKDIITYDDTRTLESVVLDDSKAYYEARNTTGSSFVCNYSIKSSVYSLIRNPYIKIKIPTGAFIADQSLYRDGVICTDFTDNTSYITVPVKNREGKITFNLTFSGDCKMITYATLNYTLNGKNDYDIIDIINNDIPVIAVYSEDITSSDTVHVSGMAPVSTDVKIAVDGTNVFTVTSNKAGSFSADIKLPSLKDGKEYTIEASANYLGETIKNETTVTYRENAPELISFTMGYKGVTYDLLSGKSYSISFVPNSTYPFHFDVKFKNPEGISSVYVSSTRNQARKSVEAKWNDDSQSFVFDGFFDTSNYAYVPGKITVRFALKYNDYEPTIDDYSEIFENATVTENIRTDDHLNIDIDLGNGYEWNYDEQKDATIEDLEKKYFPEMTDSSDSLAPVGASVSIGKGSFLQEFILKLIEKYGEKVITTVTKENIEESLIEAYIDNDEQYEIEHIFWDPVESTLKKQTLKYGVGTGIYWLGSVAKTEGTKIGLPTKLTDSIYMPYGSAVKGAGVLIGTGQTMIEYNHQMYDVDNVDRQIRNSNMSSSQKNSYLKDLNTVRRGYSAVAAMKIASTLGGVLVGAAFGPVGGLLWGVFTGILSGMVEDETDKLLDMIDTGTSSQMNFLVDPSGYVYACVEKNRVAGAKVTTYWIPYDEDDEDFWNNPDESKSQIWKAEEYSQLNPLYTDDNGDYAWDVPEGWWQVVVEKDGYETYYSEWLPVPPPQTDVNINLLSKAVPQITSATVNGSTITLVFSEYMNPETLNNISVKDYTEKDVVFTLTYSDNETSFDGTVYAKEFCLVFDESYSAAMDYYTVEIDGAKSYSNVEYCGVTQIGELKICIGDVNADGKITIDDATLVQKAVAELVVFDSVQQKAADVTGDGIVTIDDATMIQKYVAELIDHLG